MIGNRYIYYKNPQVFVLKEYDHWHYKFECGHWCTDNVFKDLIQIDIKKGDQLKLNL